MNIKFKLIAQEYGFDNGDVFFDGGELFETGLKISFLLNGSIVGGMYITEPHKFSSNDYVRILKEPTVLTYCDDDDGTITITRKNDDVIFEVGKSGNSSYAMILVVLSVYQCHKLFTKLAEWRRKFE